MKTTHYTRGGRTAHGQWCSCVYCRPQLHRKETAMIQKTEDLETMARGYDDTGCPETAAALRELHNLRAQRASSRERVATAVRGVVFAVLATERTENDRHPTAEWLIDTIANRVADALAAPQPVLDAARVREVVREAIKQEPWIMHADGIAGISITSIATRVADALAAHPQTVPDAARVRDVVLDATHKEFVGKYDDNSIVEADWTEIQHAIASRVADSLAAPQPVLDAARVRSVVALAIMGVLVELRVEIDGQRATHGDIGKLADKAATRAAKELAGAVVGVNAEEAWDRIVTIADEAFGVGPVEPLDATLARIERGIFEQHQRLANLEAQRETDLRGAFLAGTEWLSERTELGDGGAGFHVIEPSQGKTEDAAAEYARSKVGENAERERDAARAEVDRLRKVTREAGTDATDRLSHRRQLGDLRSAIGAILSNDDLTSGEVRARLRVAIGGAP